MLEKAPSPHAVQIPLTRIKTAHKFLIFAIILLLNIFSMNYGYLSWHTRTMYWGAVHSDAKAVLRWVQKTEEHCRSAKGTYCATIKELLEITLDGEKDNRERLKIAGQPQEYPGLHDRPSHEGSLYYYSIEAAGPDSFLAQARYMGYRSRGDDIWQIKQQGEPFPVVQSKEKDGFRFGELVFGSSLLFVILALIVIRSICLDPESRKTDNAKFFMFFFFYMLILVSSYFMIIG